MDAGTPAVILEPKNIQSITISIVSPSNYHEVMGPMPWYLNFKPAFSLSSFTFIRRLLVPLSSSAIRVVSSAYLRSLIFFPAILTPAGTSSSLAFHMIYSAFKLNKQGDNILPWHTPFPIWNQSVVSWQVLTIVSWLAYRFFRRQVRCSSLPHLLNFSTLCCDPHSKGFSAVNEAEVDVFLEFSCFFYDPMDVCNLISGFLCLFSIQLEYLEVLGSCTFEA